MVGFYRSEVSSTCGEPKYALELRASGENVQQLCPEGDDFRWQIKLKCGGCGETTDKWQYVTLTEKQEIHGSRGSAHLVEKCKLCGRQNTLEILADTRKPYVFAVDSEPPFQPVVTFDCRGVEPVQFDALLPGWVVRCESGTVFEDVDLTDGDWAEYDEKQNQPVRISEIESRFLHVK